MLEAKPKFALVISGIGTGPSRPIESGPLMSLDGHKTFNVAVAKGMWPHAFPRTDWAKWTAAAFAGQGADSDVGHDLLRSHIKRVGPPSPKLHLLTVASGSRES